MAKPMDADAIRQRSCASKRRYHDRDRARKIAKRQRKNGERVRAYLCTFCKGYHVGHFTDSADLFQASWEQQA